MESFILALPDIADLIRRKTKHPTTIKRLFYWENAKKSSRHLTSPWQLLRECPMIFFIHPSSTPYKEYDFICRRVDGTLHTFRPTDAEKQKLLGIKPLIKGMWGFSFGSLPYASGVSDCPMDDYSSDCSSLFTLYQNLLPYPPMKCR